MAQRAATLGFVLATALMLGVSVLAYQSADRLVVDSGWRSHTHEVIAQIHEVAARLAAAESAARGFAITGDERFAAPYRAALEEVPRAAARLRELTADNPRQQARLDGLDPLLRARLNALQELVETRRSDGSQAAARLVGGGEGQRLMDQARAELAGMDGEERVLLAERERLATASATRVNRSLAAGAALSVALLLLAFAALLREVRGRARAQAEYDRFFELSQDLLCICGRDGVFQRLNPAWQRVLGYTAEELTRRPFVEFVHPDDREPTLAVFERQLLQGAAVLSFENRYRHRDGSWRWLQWNARNDPASGLIHAIARDVTEQKKVQDEVRRARDAAEAANQELEAFSYSVSHDLRSPLRALDGFSQALLDDHGSVLDPAAQDYLHRIRAAAQRMGRLIDDLLELARITRSELEPEPVDFSALAHDVAEEVRSREPKRSVTVEVAGGVRVCGDPRLLRIALENLIANAWKFTRRHPEPRIEFGSEGHDGHRVFYIRDNGAGFDMRYAGRLFGAFQRLHSTHEFEGTGIGLATVARVVRRHGGRIWAESAPNQGASFYFTLGEPPGPPDATQEAGWATT